MHAPVDQRARHRPVVRAKIAPSLHQYFPDFCQDETSMQAFYMLLIQLVDKNDIFDFKFPKCIQNEIAYNFLLFYHRHLVQCLKLRSGTS